MTEMPLLVREIRESPRQPGRYRLLLSNGEEFLLGVDALSAVGATAVGATVTPQGLDALRHAAAVTALVDRALRSLARGRRTRLELEQRLRRVEPNRALISEALDRLEASGAISDQEAALAEATARLRRGEAPTRIRQRLRQKGIGVRESEQAVEQAKDEEGFDELASCRTQGAKRWRSLRSLDRVVARRRLMGFLLRRGFSAQHVWIVAAELERS